MVYGIHGVFKVISSQNPMHLVGRGTSRRSAQQGKPLPGAFRVEMQSPNHPCILHSPPIHPGKPLVRRYNQRIPKNSNRPTEGPLVPYKVAALDLLGTSIYTWTLQELFLFCLPVTNGVCTIHRLGIRTFLRVGVLVHD